MDTFEDNLAQCLNDIDIDITADAATSTGSAAGAESEESKIEACLARYPEQAEALRPLLRTALAVCRAQVVEPSPAFAAATRTRVINRIAAGAGNGVAQDAGPVETQSRRWSTLLLRAAAVVALVSLFLAGTAYASRDSLPDSPLYPLKRTVEQVQVATALDDTRKGRVYVKLLDQRALETAAMITAGKSQRSLEASQQYTRLLRDAAMLDSRLPVSRPENRQYLAYLRDRLVAQQAMFQRLLAGAPERDRPLINRLLNSNMRSVDEINQRLNTIFPGNAGGSA